MGKEKVTEYLIEEKKRWEHLVSHAIQNEFNPFAENGGQRLLHVREELKRITIELENHMKSL